MIRHIVSRMITPQIRTILIVQYWYIFILSIPYVAFNSHYTLFSLTQEIYVTDSSPYAATQQMDKLEAKLPKHAVVIAMQSVSESLSLRPMAEIGNEYATLELRRTLFLIIEVLLQSLHGGMATYHPMQAYIYAS